MICKSSALSLYLYIFIVYTVYNVVPLSSPLQILDLAPSSVHEHKISIILTKTLHSIHTTHRYNQATALVKLRKH